MVVYCVCITVARVRFSISPDYIIIPIMALSNNGNSEALHAWNTGSIPVGAIIYIFLTPLPL